MINETQYFEYVRDFFIGGYQLAKKWLKNRKDRDLQVNDIIHYLKVINALTETDRLMGELKN